VDVTGDERVLEPDVLFAAGRGRKEKLADLRQLGELEMLASAEFFTGAGIPAVVVPQASIQQSNGQDVVLFLLLDAEVAVDRVSN
jgi:hypothetical protein